MRGAIYIKTGNLKPPHKLEMIAIEQNEITSSVSAFHISIQQ